jgi:hypothetical protein
MRQQARDSARESAPRGSDRSATNHNTLQARETAANQRPHDRMGRQQNAGIVFGEIHLNETTLQNWERQNPPFSRWKRRRACAAVRFSSP